MPRIKEEFRNLIPPLTQEEYSQLEENIIKEGLRHSLIVWNGYIVDGHNRYEICTKHNISYTETEAKFEDEQAVREWIIRNQFGRRNLTPAQKSKLALELKPIIQEKAKQNQATSTGGRHPQLCQNSDRAAQSTIDTKKELAKIAGVSHDTIAKTEKILQKGNLEQVDRVMKGGKGNSVNAVYKEVVGNNTKICKKCHKELPVSDFYEWKGVCKVCQNSTPRLPKDVKGRTLMIDPKYKDIKDEDITRNLYNDEEIEHTIEDAIRDFTVNAETYIQSLDRILNGYKEIIMKPENNEKIMAALSEAEAAIVKLKGKYLYERL